MLKLEGPRPLWQGAGRDGVLTLPSGDSQRVMVLLGPQSTADDALARARQNARMALTLRHPGVARLVSVMEHEDRIAWCYERVEGLGLVHVVGRDDGGALGARAAAELVAQVAEVLLALGGPGLHHPGPLASDLVLQLDGHVRILGFAGPYPQDPSMRAPHADATEPGAVYRLGVLLATLLGGTPPAAASDAGGHEVIVRRALIRAMSRPGPVLSERYGQWIRHMLAWAPAERPPLSSVPAGLRSVGWATGGPGLADWAAASIPRLSTAVLERAEAQPLPSDPEESDPGELLAIVEAGPPPPRPFPEVLGDTIGRHPTPTSEGVFADATLERADDDVTQEATLDPELQAAPSRPRPSRKTQRPDTIPVDIGPPAEALKKRPPTLPPGFLERDPADVPDASDPVVTLPAPKWWHMDRRLAFGWGGAAVGLVILALVFLAYLCWGPADVSTAPGGAPMLRDTIAPGPTGTAPTLRPGGEVPSPDQFGELDTDLYETDEPPVRQAPPTVDPSRPPRGEDEVSVLFRLADGQRGKIYVSCEPNVVTRQGFGQLRLTLHRGDVCEVGSRSPEGTPLRVRGITVDDYATVDCFRGWVAECVQ